MGIGGSDGAYYEDGFDHLTNNDGNKPEESDVQPKRSRAPSDVGITFRNPNPNPAGTASSGGRSQLNPDDLGVLNPDTDSNPHITTQDWNELTPEQGMGLQWNSKNMPTPETIGYKDIEDRRDWSPLQSAGQFVGDTVKNLPAAAEDLFRNPAGQAMTSNTPMGEQLGMKDLPEPGQSWVDRLSIVNALKGMANGPNTDEDISMLKGFYDTIKGYMGLTHDVYGGKVDPMSQQGIEKSADLAGLMVFGPMPVAEKLAEGTLGSFGGLRSLRTTEALADEGSAALRIRQDMAQRMEQRGLSKDLIWAKTGWMRGTDNRWRYEIDDSQAKFNPDWHKHPNPADAQPGDKITANLSDVWDHPELYKAYPELKDMDVIYDPKLQGAFYDPSNKSITLGGKPGSQGYNFNSEGTLAHEVQHAIQDIEGFGKGGSRAEVGQHYELKLKQDYEDFLKEAKVRLPDINDKYSKKGALGLTNDDLDFIHKYNEVVRKWPEYIDAAQEKAHEHYERLAGEVEARNVSDRLSMNKEQRRKFSPIATQDRPTYVQKATQKPLYGTAYGYQDEFGTMRSQDNVTNFRRPANDNEQLSPLDLAHQRLDLAKRELEEAMKNQPKQ